MRVSLSKNRIDHCFSVLRKAGRRAFVAYITAGDPSLEATSQLARAFEKAGVDILELGVPFSDPLADGVVNQLAADRALRSGTTLAGVLATVRELRTSGVEIPIVLFTYFNPIHRYGFSKFVRDATGAGVDGVLNLDLPPEESGGYENALSRAGIHPIHLVAPTTDGDRLKGIARKAKGFIYYVSREGVTGMQKQLKGGMTPRIREIRRESRVPVVVGFGISTPAQVKQAAMLADGCVVGSAIVNRIAKHEGRRDMVPRVSRFVSSLVRGISRV